MNDEFCKQTLITDELGNISMQCKYDLAGELAYEITRRKESLWKSFCKNVCEKTITDMVGEVDLVDFINVFDRSFEEETKKWKEL